MKGIQDNRGWLARLLDICSPSLMMIGECPCSRCGLRRSDIVTSLYEHIDAINARHAIHVNTLNARIKAKDAKLMRAAEMINTLKSESRFR